MQSKTYNISFNTNYLEHVGNKNSGRYPRGSGENPYQHDKSKSKRNYAKAGLLGAGIATAEAAVNYPFAKHIAKNAVEIENDMIKSDNYWDKEFYGIKGQRKLIDIPAFMRNFKIGYIIGGGIGALAYAGIAVGSNYGSKRLFDVMMDKKLKKVKIKDVEGFKQRLQSDTSNRRALLSSLGLIGVGINAIVDDSRLEKELKNYKKVKK